MGVLLIADIVILVLVLLSLVFICDKTLPYHDRFLVAGVDALLALALLLITISEMLGRLSLRVIFVLLPIYVVLINVYTSLEECEKKLKKLLDD